MSPQDAEDGGGDTNWGKFALCSVAGVVGLTVLGAIFGTIGGAVSARFMKIYSGRQLMKVGAPVGAFTGCCIGLVAAGAAGYYLATGHSIDFLE